MEFGRKRSNGGNAVYVNGGTKRYKQESESATGVGSKSKPCMKFFSTTGCSFGESCHFLHYVPGGFKPIAQMTNMPSAPSFYPPSKNNMGAPPPSTNTPPSAVKTKLCNRYNSAEGCKYGDNCHFAHGEKELGLFSTQSYEPRGPMPPPQHNFGASATAKIAVDAVLAGPIIGKGGCHSKQICKLTGVKFSIKEIESDPNKRNIELEGTFDQIQQASAMVRDIIVSLGPINPPPVKANMGNPAAIKTKLCEHFLRGSCNYGDKCNFAHGETELRNNQVA